MNSFSTKLFLIPFVLLMFFFVASAQLPDLIQESFDYPIGGDLEGNGDASGGWAGPWEYTNPAAGYVLLYSGTVGVDPLPCDTAGNYIEVQNETGDLAMWRILSEPMLDEGQTFWISVLYQRIEGDYDADESYNGLSLFNDAAELVYIGKPWLATDLGVDAHGGSGNTPLEGYNAMDGAWIVIKFVLDGDDSAVSDSGYIYMNPDPNTEPTQEEALASFYWAGNNGWDRFRIGCNNACWVAYDEIKIAANYLDLNKGPDGIFTSPVGNLPYKFALEQNYPNPFNPTTTISYNVPTASDVKIAVFDVLGQEITTLVNEQKMPGTYQASFDASNLTSGVYFYQMQAGSFSETRKMMLVR
jgi:hypothetical protein